MDFVFKCIIELILNLAGEFPHPNPYQNTIETLWETKASFTNTSSSEPSPHPHQDLSLIHI